MNKKIISIIIAIIILALAGYWLYVSDSAKEKKLEAFATCLSNKGVKFYGAFWCPHCQNEKSKFETWFGSAVDKLPYVECSTPDSQGELDVCKNEGIEGYPTWKFSDGSKQEGELSLQQLSDKTGCPVPN